MHKCLNVDWLFWWHQRFQQSVSGLRKWSLNIPPVQRLQQRVLSASAGSACKVAAAGPAVPPERQLTAMLVAVSVAFVCLRMPYTVAFYVHSYRNQLWGVVSPQLEFITYSAYKLTDIVATSNYVVNFFLYSMCGSYFRQQVNDHSEKKLVPEPYLENAAFEVYQEAGPQLGSGVPERGGVKITSMKWFWLVRIARAYTHTGGMWRQSPQCGTLDKPLLVGSGEVGRWQRSQNLKVWRNFIPKSVHVHRNGYVIFSCTNV